MVSFDQLFSDTADLYDDELKEYFDDFFIVDNFDDYLIDENASKEDIESIRLMFENKEDIVVRALHILKDNPYCLEANFVLYGIGEDEIVSDCFLELYLDKDNYCNLSDYQKKCYLTVLHLYSEYLLDIHSIKKAINVIKDSISLRGYPNLVDIDRLSYMYCLLEDADSFLGLYDTYGFLEPLPYILLITVLLKCDKDDKAKEIYNQLLNRYPLACYLDHLYDLDEIDDEEAIEFKRAIEFAFEEICSVPNFFKWCANNKAGNYQS